MWFHRKICNAWFLTRKMTENGMNEKPENWQCGTSTKKEELRKIQSENWKSWRLKTKGNKKEMEIAEQNRANWDFFFLNSEILMFLHENFEEA